MSDERRVSPRVTTHIVLEMMIVGEAKRYIGYVENLSESGIGIVSLEPLATEKPVTLGFYVSDAAGKLSPTVSLVHTRIGPDTLYYHGFRFEQIRETERESISQFIQEQLA